jgi:hypothetical protein
VPLPALAVEGLLPSLFTSLFGDIPQNGEGFLKKARMANRTGWGSWVAEEPKSHDFGYGPPA